MKKSSVIYIINRVLPLLSLLVYFMKPETSAGVYATLMSIMLMGCVLCGVHHAEIVALKVGEPFGTLVLAISITIIEVALILTLQAAGGDSASTYARDTVLAAIIIIITGIVGMCLLVGGLRHKEQRFSIHGMSAAVMTLTAISLCTLILPNYTSSSPGPYYNKSQLIFVSIVSLVLYLSFVFVQAVRHREYFLPNEEEGEEHAAPPTMKQTIISFLLLIVSLVGVVLLAKSVSPTLEKLIDNAGAPKSLVGVIIAMVILLPEGIAALKNAINDRLQTSLNLALGSALASIGLTIPAVAMYSVFEGTTLTLGIDIKSTILLLFSIYLLSSSFRTGRTTIMQGIVLLILFATYLFLSIVP